MRVKLTAKQRWPHFKGNLFIAVFNCTKHGQRMGRKAVIERFGDAGWSKVREINKTGIMAMFNVMQTPETKLFAEVVADYAERKHGKFRKQESV